MTIAVWTAGVAALAVPFLSHIQSMPAVNAGQMPAACTLQHIEYLDAATGETKLTEWQTYDCGAGLGVIVESGK